MRQTRTNTLQRGLTLIELLVTMAIAAILLTIAVPSFIDFITSSTASGYANDLLADLNLARSEAIARGVRVTLCHSNDKASCSGTWSDGWIVFANTNTAGTQNTVDAGDQVLRVHAAVNAVSGWALNANSNFANFVAFQPDGRSNLKGTFVFCRGGVLHVGNQTRSAAVTVYTTGWARLLPYNANGVPVDDHGNALTTCTP